MIFLGLGSNIGDRAAHIREALRQMQAQGIGILRVSSLYETAPWGIDSQANFLNAVCEVSWAGDPEALLTCLLDTETHMGRQRLYKWGPRLIDLDILEYQRLHWHSPALTLPHPYYPERMFVLAPLAELEPDWIPTGQRASITELMARLNPADILAVHALATDTP
ncbi:MAG: 2-amino-4-hydroxy-6-hydroxymethyldihydropteridine diphosphokinase [Bacteroidia bacterium]|nr:2-amino-4-hydroxy-6-hydroxymethyldihydropteridine diphosphokinase [Bacteroidia bacterium]